MKAAEKDSAIDSGKPFKLVKYFAATSLIVALILTVILSGLLANQARQGLMERYEDYALLLAANLNHQVFRQFVLPTATLYGKIDLSSDYQYNRMDKVVRQTIHSLNIHQVNIYDVRGMLVYTTGDLELGKPVQNVTEFEAARAGQSVSTLVSEPSLIDRIIYWRLTQPATLKTLTPFRAEQLGVSFQPRPVLGVFELIMDITPELEQIFKQQVLTTMMAVALMVVLIIILTLIVRKGERILTRRAEERLRLEDKLREAERLASLGRMVASVSHEIKGPLGIIRSTGEFLSSQADGDDRSQKLTNAIVEECTRLNGIVTEFLDFARPQQPNLQPCPVGELLSRNLTALEVEMEKQGIKAVTDLDRAPEIEADPDMLYRAFLNVLVNAIQAMPQGGKLEVSARPNQRPGSCLIEISDTGTGIDQESMARVFEPFFTLKKKGTGLGLAIVKSIIEAHRGTIEIDSTPGKATRVTIIL